MSIVLSQYVCVGLYILALFVWVFFLGGNGKTKMWWEALFKGTTIGGISP